VKYTVVNTGGMSWRVVSRNEREATHNGRHFFARRCRPGVPWLIEELDRSITDHGIAEPLYVWANGYEVNDLSGAVRDICDTSTEHLHQRVSWSEHRKRLLSSRAEHSG
jgi:hypothetical protein